VNGIFKLEKGLPRLTNKDMTVSLINKPVLRIFMKKKRRLNHKKSIFAALNKMN